MLGFHDTLYPATRMVAGPVLPKFVRELPLAVRASRRTLADETWWKPTGRIILGAMLAVFGGVEAFVARCAGDPRR